MTALNPCRPNEIFYLKFLDRSISNRKGVWLVLLLPCFTEIPVFNENRLDPDQTPRSVASDLDLDCLPMSHLWVNEYMRQIYTVCYLFIFFFFFFFFFFFCDELVCNNRHMQSQEWKRPLHTYMVKRAKLTVKVEFEANEALWIVTISNGTRLCVLLNIVCYDTFYVAYLF